jgi:hypothetical protein
MIWQISLWNRLITKWIIQLIFTLTGEEAEQYYIKVVINTSQVQRDFFNNIIIVS